MIYINLENAPPSPEWIKKADDVTAKLVAEGDSEKRNEIIEKNAKIWGELKDHLSKLSHDKCWYTESKNAGGYCHVDHFRPKKKAIDENGDDKGGYWWLAFDWMNYRFSSPASNTKKNAYFHVTKNKAVKYGDNINKEHYMLLDPIKFTDPDLLAFDNEGMAQPKSPNKNTIDYKRACYSILRLNLNYYKIVEQRKDYYRKATNKIFKIKNLLKLQDVNLDYDREIEIGDLMKELWEMCCRNSEYSAAVKYCLKSTGEDWAIGIVNKAA
ncbi:hypothetical protein AWE51_05600 [Aquimarina aggregata]|uniref:TIGR02646 family protein n=1 Tax=Aquimarina aggregata TaxID=1642818 RepID=A0A163ABV0_9FLAO|nr:hypothetical protein [Aquimarina aggregata]KZS40425.1 hypothetical protein AWE51_05600 [Aquimarina aggregata]